MPSFNLKPLMVLIGVWPLVLAEAELLTSDADLHAAHEVIQKLEDRPMKYLSVANGLFEEAGVSGPTELIEAYTQSLSQSLDRLIPPDEKVILLERIADQAQRIRVAVRKLMPAVAAWDPPDDDGLTLMIDWQPHPEAGGYLVERREVADIEETWLQVFRSDSARRTSHVDAKKTRIEREYVYRVFALPMDSEGELASDAEPILLGTTDPVKGRADYWHDQNSWFAVFLTLICGSVVFWIVIARSSSELKIRKIAGLEAVDEAVGRATEMGRPILFVPGIRDMDEIQTLAGVTVLGRVARTAAEHDAELEVPVCMPLVLTAARETVHASYTDAGRPDAYDEKKIYFTTQEQFGYVATVTGTMVREEPATCIYMGAFFAESLILAETANSIGSIQIAGTAMPAQLPFFVAACDYTLIGEEFMAASAYLSGDAQQLGSLKGQDFGKLLVGLFVVLGVIVATLMELTLGQYSTLGELLNFLKIDVLKVSG